MVVDALLFGVLVVECVLVSDCPCGDGVELILGAGLFLREVLDRVPSVGRSPRHEVLLYSGHREN